MQLGKAGLDLIIEFEGFVPYAYWDHNGRVWTIGYGTTSSADDGPVRPGMTCTREQAVKWLEHTVNVEIIPELERVAARREKHTGHMLNQNQTDALCSLAYNLSVGVLAPTHTVGRDLADGAPAGRVAEDFIMYDRSGGQVLAGLVRRRNAERALFLTPVQAA